MKKELTFSLEYWKDRAEFFEKQIAELRDAKAELRNYIIDHLEEENKELKQILAKLSEAITLQLKRTDVPCIPQDKDTLGYVKAFRGKSVRVEDLNMTTRTTNCLKFNGMETLGDVCKYTESELFSLPNFGRKSMYELKEILLINGLSLKY